jgi:hypothetical protein
MHMISALPDTPAAAPVSSVLALSARSTVGTLAALLCTAWISRSARPPCGAGYTTSATSTSTPISPRSTMSRHTPSAGRWRPRSTRSSTPRPRCTISVTPPRPSPNGTTSTAGSWCPTAEQPLSDLLPLQGLVTTTLSASERLSWPRMPLRGSCVSLKGAFQYSAAWGGLTSPQVRATFHEQGDAFVVRHREHIGDVTRDCGSLRTTTIGDRRWALTCGDADSMRCGRRRPIVSPCESKRAHSEPSRRQSPTVANEHDQITSLIPSVGWGARARRTRRGEP